MDTYVAAMHVTDIAYATLIRAINDYLTTSRNARDAAYEAHLACLGDADADLVEADLRLAEKNVSIASAITVFVEDIDHESFHDAQFEGKRKATPLTQP